MAANGCNNQHNEAMNFWQFAGDHPFLAFCIVYMCTATVYCSVVWSCRCLNIRKQGWPPPHCDADGDPRERQDESNA